MMNLEQINIRDPFVMEYDGSYYMYGTRTEGVWGEMDGFDCYVSDDCVQWNGPVEVFHKPEGFWAERAYWAPECYRRNGKFYLIATLADAEGRKSVNVLESESPVGPFVYLSRLTDPAQACIDGTLYEEDDKVYLVYSHSLEDVPEGNMDAVEVSSDLTYAIGNPFTVFQASDASWSVPVPFAKAEFGIDGPAYFSDGPFLEKTAQGKLVMLWSSWSDQGYSVGQAVSSDGSIRGRWTHENRPLIGQGGHGMLFTGPDGKRYFAMHAQNGREPEHPRFLEVTESERGLDVRI
ncbi:glycoside hydrolase family 43 protein [Bifidobacterium eulemuris]|uniref:Family 43 glycosylhydrolase n=2 Tax=Bifidobacterium eulemuris TaxID=1765219 RepID=A0A7L9SRS5_9BIFI|nr:glycoside hydrolase family 43 protein [Bifidobacterium eulemuris]QOL32877.1 family 43 glycosylhydrolase [Bifidobacterium eulemuris]